MKKKETIIGYEFVFQDDNIVYFKQLKKTKFVAILLVLTIGLIKHKYVKKNFVKVIFNHNIDKEEIKLVYLISYSLSRYESVMKAFNKLIEFAKDNNCKTIETIVVNKRLSTNILKRNDFYFVKKNWFLGNHFKKKLL